MTFSLKNFIFLINPRESWVENSAKIFSKTYALIVVIPSLTMIGVVLIFMHRDWRSLIKNNLGFWSFIKLIIISRGHPFPITLKNCIADTLTWPKLNLVRMLICMTLDVNLLEILFKRSCYLPSRIKNNIMTIKKDRNFLKNFKILIYSWKFHFILTHRCNQGKNH